MTTALDPSPGHGAEPPAHIHVIVLPDRGVPCRAPTWLHQSGRLADHKAFEGDLAPLPAAERVVYATRPSCSPKAVPAYLSRYIHRVAIAAARQGIHLGDGQQ